MAARNNGIVLMPERTVAYFRAEMAKYAAVVKGAGLELA